MTNKDNNFFDLSGRSNVRNYEVNHNKNPCKGNPLKALKNPLITNINDESDKIIFKKHQDSHHNTKVLNSKKTEVTFSGKAINQQGGNNRLIAKQGMNSFVEQINVTSSKIIDKSHNNKESASTQLNENIDRNFIIDLPAKRSSPVIRTCLVKIKTKYEGLTKNEGDNRGKIDGERWINSRRSCNA